VQTGWSPLRRADVSTANTFSRYLLAHSTQAAVWRTVTDVGGPGTFEGLAVVAVGVVWWRRRRALAVFVAVSMLGELALSRLVKLAVDRARPSFAHSVAHASGASFPSGHALASFVGAGALLAAESEVVRRSARWFWFATSAIIVIVVGFSRVVLSVHYISDVLGSWLLGAAWLLLLIVAFRSMRTASSAPDRRLA